MAAIAPSLLLARRAFAHRALMLLGLVIPANGLAAQTWGDSIRVRTFANAAWQHGTLVGGNSMTLVLREQSQQRAYPLANLRRVDVWKRKNAAVEIFVRGAVWGAGWALGAAIDKDHRAITGSRGGDAAAAAGAGMLVGAVSLAMTPGKWYRLRLRRLDGAR
jgi:hypothetical protein